MQRRDALKQLGALAISAPALTSLACGEEAPSAHDAGAAPAITGGSDAASSATSTTSTPSDAAMTSHGADPGKDGAADVPTPDAGDVMSDPGSASDAQVSSVDADAGPSSPSGFYPPQFSDAATCTLTATDTAGEGPFFVHEDEVMTDESLLRVDMREGKPGVELQLNLRLLDFDEDCAKPIADTEVYVWHTDALGFYSGFNNQNPDQTYSGAFERTVENDDRFCRAMQVTNADGVVSFRSIYPGWYNGRPIHIHFVALRKGSGPATTGSDSYRDTKYMMFTTQMYFEEAFSRNIHENNAPYDTRLTGGYATYVKPNAMSQVRPTTRLEGNVVVASLNIITSATGSRATASGFGGFFGGA